MTPLEARLRDRLAAAPMRLDVFLELCLGDPEHGYYMTRDPFGTDGDFVTAPEVSQMFGELIGLWLVQAWIDQGRPAPFVLAELGPGRGTLMRDALRAARVVPDFAAAADLWLVETSPILRARQTETLAAHAPSFADELESLPAGPLFLVANEFFDALPIRQFRRTDVYWSERMVVLDEEGLVFRWALPRADAGLNARFPLVSDGTIVEVSAAGEAAVAELGARIAGAGGAALIIDYGSAEGTGDTLQALERHRMVHPLTAPGAVDLTAHVGFGALARAAQPARASGPVPQGRFLGALGLSDRAAMLGRGRDADTVAALAAAQRRLTHPEEMGELFQVMALLPDASPPPGGFEP